MILTRLEQSDYDRLIEIQNNVPALTFQHEPYQEWIPKHFTENDLKALDEVKAIVRKAIYGFKNFTNFYQDKKGELRIRFYYDWSFSFQSDNNKIIVRTGIPFTGVGYLSVSELLNGFK